MTTPETPMERVPLPPVGSILHNGSTVLAAVYLNDMDDESDELWLDEQAAKIKKGK